MSGVDITVLIIALVIVLIALSFALYAKSEGSNGGAVTGLVLAVLTLAGSGVFVTSAIVKAPDVGVKVSMGKPVASLDSGWTWKAPWEKVIKFDGRKQISSFTGDGAIKARLGDFSDAGIDTTIQWQVKPDKVDSLFADYREPENIEPNLVVRNFKATVNEVLGGYNPLDEKNMNASEESVQARLAAKVRDSMERKIGDRIEITDVTIPHISYDPKTEANLASIRSEVVRLDAAKKRRAANEEEAKANAALSNSLDPLTMWNKCLEIVKESGQAPLGCAPGSGSAQPIVDTRAGE